MKSYNVKRSRFQYAGGLIDFLKSLVKEKSCILEKPLEVSEQQNGLSVDIILNWYENGTTETVECYTNTIHQKEGGRHLVGLRSALTRVLNQYLDKEGFFKKFKVQVIGEDFREGLIGALSIMMPDPRFSSQTKQQLVSPEARTFVDGVVAKKLEAFLQENPVAAKAIAVKAIRAAQGREAAAKARRIARQGSVEIVAETGKLAPCQDKNPANCELFIVEGKSAGGPVKQARSRKFQAVLPLRGKILNTERVSPDKILASNEIATLIAVLGCGVGTSYQPEKLRYHHIIIMTDADVDGAHIRTLLLTFFYRQFPDLIEKGYVYIAHPPLYKLKKAKQEVYLQDDAELEKWLADNILDGVEIFDNKREKAILKGEALATLIAEYREIKAKLKAWEKEYPLSCLSTLLELKPITRLQLKDLAYMESLCQRWQALLDTQLTETDTSYHITCSEEARVEETDESEEGGDSERGDAVEKLYLPTITEIRYNIKTDYQLSCHFFESHDYQSIAARAKEISQLIPEHSMVKQGSKEKEISSVYELYEWLMQEARRGYTIQRYKGLGEMNWEELLPVVEPQTRQLSRVTTADAEQADRMVTILMGDIVDDRRKFIEENALDVTEIDI